MNLPSVFTVLSGFPRKVIDAARNVIIFVRNSMPHLTGAEQHMEAVKLLTTGFSSLPKWAAHALIGVTFGWIEKHMPERLTPAIGEIGEAVTKAVDQAISSLKASPFDGAQAALQPLPIRPPAPVGVGESSPQNAAQPQLPLAPPGLSPSALVG